ncbi:hypothetical protein CHS0354_036805, partial [Potamilus streckersoni]
TSHQQGLSPESLQDYLPVTYGSKATTKTQKRKALDEKMLGIKYGYQNSTSTFLPNPL